MAGQKMLKYVETTYGRKPGQFLHIWRNLDDIKKSLFQSSFQSLFQGKSQCSGQILEQTLEWTLEQTLKHTFFNVV